MRILGLIIGHDGSAALIKDGKVVAAMHEERLSRIKKDISFPREAIKECLRIGKLKPEDIDAVAVAGARDTASRAQLEFIYHRKRIGKVRGVASRTALKLGAPSAADQYLRAALSELGIDAPIRRYNHHRCHAASGYYTAGLKDPLVITLDGAGDTYAGTVSIINNGKLSQLHTVAITDSPGMFYSGVTKHLGLRPLRHEGKVTGLAAYGNPDTYHEALKRILWYEHGGRDLVSKEFREIERRIPKAVMDFAFDLARGQDTQLSYRANAMRRVFERILPEVRSVKQDRKIAEDIAAAAQRILEQAVVAFAEYWLKETGKREIILAGGIFGNVKLNQRIHELPQVDHIVVHPAMGDEGLGVGAALLDHALQTGSKPYRINDVYFGPSYTDEEMLAAAKRHGVKLTRMRSPAKEIASLLADGKVIGHFNGRMEYGPRALGNRTILALPTDASINDWLNKRLRRTEYMPFAPIILEDALPKCYAGTPGAKFTAQFMTITFDVKPPWPKKAPAVSHIDNTARPQAVTKKTNARAHAILTELKKKTGLPLCINTSFNMHEEPIVCSPDDALRAFKAGSVDVLVLGSYRTQT